MSTDSFPASSPLSGVGSRESQRGVQPLQLAVQCLKVLASLKLTVVLFAMAIFIIFVGTLAQVEKDMWEVIDQYFRAFFALVELRIFFPRSFFPNIPTIGGAFYFPGGVLIGMAMFVNLTAAHAVRFRVQAKGQRMWWGIGAMVAGALVTWLVIASGHNREGLQGEPIVGWPMMWDLMKWALAVGWAAALLMLARSDWKNLSAVLGWGSLVLGLGSLLFYLVTRGEAAQLSDSSLRILWQLIQGTAAAVVLLTGCLLLFKRRGGIVLIHLGVGLVMLGELLVSLYAVEERMTIAENETVNFARDIRTTELAIVDTSDAEHDEVVVIPHSMLKEGKRITHELLPFELEVVKYFKNSQLTDIEAVKNKASASDEQADPSADPEESVAQLQAENLATAGWGKRYVARARRAGSGASSSEVDTAACYVRVKPKLDEQAGGDTDGDTYMLSQQFGDGAISTVGRQDINEPIDADGKTYNVSLRFKRNYKPYSMTLTDVSKDDYIGTNTPRNYSSDVRLVDPDRNMDREIHIWMNNPLRYRGETFYQSNYTLAPGGVEITDLQVVTNTGWMIPYVACMLVGWGLLTHFSFSLQRFMNRQLSQSNGDDGQTAPVKTNGDQHRSSNFSDIGFILPLLVVCVFGFWIWNAASKAKSGTPVAAEEMDTEAFGQIPIVFEGRVKPIDTLARNALRILSDKQTYTDEAGNEQPAIRWLLDLIAFKPEASQHEVVRIHNLEVLATLGLERRPRYRFSLDEIRGPLEQFEDGGVIWLPTTEVDRLKGDFYRQVRDAVQLSKDEPTQVSLYQRKLVELAQRLAVIDRLQASFRPIQFPALPTKEQLEADPKSAEQTRDFILRAIKALPTLHQGLMKLGALPMVVPVGDDEQDWQPYAMAADKAYVRRILQRDVNERVISWAGIINAYARGNAADFNNEVNNYHAGLRQAAPSDINFAKIDFEVFFNQFKPFYLCMVLYIIAFVITVLGWLAKPTLLGRMAFWLLVLTTLLHTYAIVARIYISGRPPVTNLYTTAIFIGWGCVVLGLVLEWFYGRRSRVGDATIGCLGIGNVVAAFSGFCTLFIAHNLAGDGDTFKVLQAVLDTQFWLATHVICINLGYATTLLAGALGVVYILRGVVTPSLSAAASKDLARMIYGVLCFAIFFSFVGTVLGGLWADDSWGRFWGWDPKENGALIIVLWNALILHARWGGMVRDRGLAVLSVAGNITTSWSWFGVNELGIGLHSYGFTEGVVRNLAFFVMSQLLMIGLGLLPFSLWWSHRRAMEGS